MIWVWLPKSIAPQIPVEMLQLHHPLFWTTISLFMDGMGYIFFLFFIWLKIEHAICIGITYNSFSTIPSDSCAVVRCCSTYFLRHFRGVFFAGHGFPGIMEGWLGEVWSPHRCLKDPIPITLRKSSPNRIFPVKNQGFYHKGLCDFTWPFPTMV